VWTRVVTLSITLLPGPYSIARLPASAPAPDLALDGDGDSIRGITRTAGQLSIVCPSHTALPDVLDRSDGWRCLRLDGTFDLHETGVLARVVVPLAQVRISVFVLSTFDTDYILIRESQCLAAISALRAAGHAVSGP